MLIYWEARCWESFNNRLWDSCLSQITVKEGKWPGRVATSSCQRAICAGGGDWQMCYEGFSLILSRQCRCLSRLPHGNQSGVRSLHFLCPLPPPICRSTWSLNIADFYSVLFPSASHSIVSVWFGVSKDSFHVILITALVCISDNLWIPELKSQISKADTKGALSRLYPT